MLVLFLAGIVWALVATFRFHAPFDGFQISLLVLIVGLASRPTRVAAILVFILLFAVLEEPMREVVLAPARSSQCRNRLKQIVRALHNYHDDYGCFPPAYVADEDGRPMHSRRVLILPYIEETARYEQYRFDEPWDGSDNSQLVGQAPYDLQCPVAPNRDSASTSYVLIVGDGTGWADGRSPKLDDFTDGADRTIVLAEITGSNIPWMEPRDLTLEEAARGINSGSAMCISSWHPAGGHRMGQDSANVAFADGSAVNLKNDFPLEELRKLLTYQGGEKVIPPE